MWLQTTALSFVSWSAPGVARHKFNYGLEEPRLTLFRVQVSAQPSPHWAITFQRTQRSGLTFFS
jgi:hypothetical protein